MKTQDKQLVPIVAKVVWRSGMLWYNEESYPKKVVAVMNVQEYFAFNDFLALRQLNFTTPVAQVQELYHNFATHRLLQRNGIDMCPVNHPIHDKVNLVKLMKSVWSFVRKRLGGFLLKKQTL